MAARCEKTDLPEDMCSHCLGHVDPEQQERRDLAALLLLPGWIAAQYPGVCSGCGERYGAGMPIHIDRDEQRWLAGCCADQT